MESCLNFLKKGPGNFLFFLNIAEQQISTVLSYRFKYFDSAFACHLVFCAYGNKV